ncbi:MAG: twin-arginine translocation signal domain-containing protein [Candidatus Hydrogenedentes bacterium]|nr:twin-arginine translocation signal domain-containing protein [Candidatus Hydrogenedentota bacterium]
MNRRQFLNHSAAAGVAALALPRVSSANAAQQDVSAQWNRLGWAPGNLAAMHEAVEQEALGTVGQVQLEARAKGEQAAESALQAGLAAAFLLTGVKPVRCWRYGSPGDGAYQLVVAETAERMRIVVRVNAPGKLFPCQISGDKGRATLQGLGEARLADAQDRPVKTLAAVAVSQQALGTVTEAARTALAQAHCM